METQKVMTQEVLPQGYINSNNCWGRGRFSGELPASWAGSFIDVALISCHPYWDWFWGDAVPQELPISC